MSLAILGSIDPLNVLEPLDGFDRPQTSTMVMLLSDGTSGDNEVMQQGSQPLRRANIRGRTRDPDVLTTLRGYYDSKDLVVFTDCDAVSTNVQVFELRTWRGYVGMLYYEMTLIEAV